MDITQVLLHLVLLVQMIHSERQPTWDACNCRFESWGAWSQCTKTCGGGLRRRSRSVWSTNKPGCNEFSDCATPGSGWQTDPCNNICFNGGTFKSFWCSCMTGWRGGCCDDRVTCGNPGSIVDGGMKGNDFTYGKSVAYTCNNLHNMTAGSSERTCNQYGVWNGTTPECTFVHTCLSNPCQNGGSCVDGLNRYNCQCPSGWSGIHCERDIQPPVMVGCPSDINIVTGKPHTYVNWTEPTFTDPMGTPIITTRNFPTNHWEFPWGDFTVQFRATKPENGLSTECTFDVKVRPNQCSDLNVPVGGAKVCNGWKTDFGQYCLFFCDASHDVYPGTDINQWYVCGASGAWKPSNKLPDCEASLSWNIRPGNDAQTFHFESCSDPQDIAKLQEAYVEGLQRSQFADFCSAYDDMCYPSNVDVFC